eukprot:m.302740 g.302740  ORF g.302740 m.302740 type:complete len:373 (+) comp20153_c0_seq2:124-1242(+)
MAAISSLVLSWLKRLSGGCDESDSLQNVVGVSKKHFIVGSRKSQLAMWQTTHVVSQLKALYPGYTFSVETMETIGDKVLDVALSKIGTKSLFTKELEVLLVSNAVDFVVHSLKDLPTTLPEGLVIGAIGEREDPRDGVIFRKDHTNEYKCLADLPADAVIGTSSLRRTAQLSARYPHLKFESVRGNLNTRLAKLDSSTNDGAEGKRYAALVLAVSGVIRMGWRERIGEFLDAETNPFAVSQGSLGIECRKNDTATCSLLAALNHKESSLRCTAERAFMRKLEGGCSVPIGVNSYFDDDKTSGSILRLQGAVHSLDGQTVAKAAVAGEVQSECDAEALGYPAAVLLLVGAPRWWTLECGACACVFRTWCSCAF